GIWRVFPVLMTEISVLIPVAFFPMTVAFLWLILLLPLFGGFRGSIAGKKMFSFVTDNPPD
ncbi:MAG: hypothetical protein KIG47_01930, partial [Prevotellamassilia sp.]|nr:hypothetical protein [Prevotellamassilia sp.]